MGDVGSVAELIKAIFTWAVDPEGYHALSLERQLATLHDAAQKALVDKDFVAVDALILEYRRLQHGIV